MPTAPVEKDDPTYVAVRAEDEFAAEPIALLVRLSTVVTEVEAKAFTGDEALLNIAAKDWATESAVSFGT
jgi:hypothetical protein